MFNFKSNNEIERTKDCGYPNRFWVKGDNNLWSSINVTDSERLLLRYLRKNGVEYDNE